MLSHGYFAKDLVTADGYTLSARASKKQTYKMIPPTSAKNAQQEAKQHYNYNGHDAPREDAPTSDNNNAQKPDNNNAQKPEIASSVSSQFGFSGAKRPKWRRKRLFRKFRRFFETFTTKIVCQGHFVRTRLCVRMLKKSQICNFNAMSIFAT